MSKKSKAAAIRIKIPPQNLWLLMVYASDFFTKFWKSERLDWEKNPEDIPDLIAKILINSVKRRLRRGLSVEFRRRRFDLTRVRGRIDPVRTERRHLRQRGRIACLFDELNVDTPNNRYVKAALMYLGRNIRNVKTKQHCRACITALERAGVGGDGHTIASIFGTARAPVVARGADPEDAKMLAAAELALNLGLPSGEHGSMYLPDLRRHKLKLFDLFEKAVRGFYYVKLPSREWVVSETHTRLYWQTAPLPNDLDGGLPDMETDMVLKRLDARTNKISHVMIIDTKFTNILGKRWVGKNKLKSNHIYQMYAYLRSQEHRDDDDDDLWLSASGMLLYPAVKGDDHDWEVIIQGRRIRFATVNLAKSGVYITKRLLDLVNSK